MPAGSQPGPDEFADWLARRRRAMDTGTELHWCIADLADDVMLGNVQIFHLEPAEGRFQGELGYWLRPGARGHGFIGEAIEAVVAHAFSPVVDGGLGLIRLYAGTDSDNYASHSILRSAGFTQWGADHQAWRRSDGSLSDGVYFELLASEQPNAEQPNAEQPTSTDRHVAVASASALADATPTSSGPAVLDGERVRLRPWSDDDLSRLVDGLADWMSRPVDESDARRWLARRRPPSRGRLPEQDRTRGPDGRLVSWCIADLSTDEALGNIDVFDIGRPMLPGGCELGYWTHPDSRGQGLMTDALRRLLPHLLGSTESGGLGLRRVTARTSELNAASKSVMSAVGMRQWGAAPGGSIAPDGTAVRQLHFAVLADELDPATGRVQGNASAVEPITLEGNGIRLREWRHTDAERVMEACSDEQTRHWLAGSLPSPYTLDQAHSYIRGCIDEARDGKAVYWCVADLESDLCLGSVSVMDLRNAFGTAGEIGYWLHPDARGRGVMSRAVGLVVRHAFIAREDGGLGRIRLRLNAADGNLASQQIARTNGFVEVGRDRLAEPLGDGTFADLVRFDLLVDEWNAAD